MGLDDFMKKAVQARPDRFSRAAPLGLCVTIGRRARRNYGDKATEGAVIDKEHLYVLEFKPSEQVTLGGRPADARAYHPAFVTRKDNAPVPVPFPRLIVTFVHEKLADAIDVARKCHSSREVCSAARVAEPPGRRLFCLSEDDETAQRWNGTDCTKIRCPGDACPFAEAGQCKQHTKAVFQLDPIDLEGRVTPSMLAYYQTRSVQTRDLWLAFVHYLRGEFARLGIPEDVRGVKAEISVQIRRGKGKAWPVLNVALYGDLEAQILQGAARRAEIVRVVGDLITAREASTLYPQTDDAELQGDLLRPMVLPRPDGVRDPEPERGGNVASERNHEPPPQEAPPTGPRLPEGAPALTLGPSVPTSPGGEPTCPLCDALMTPARGQRGWGWLCVERTNGCKGARVWDGSVPERVSE